MACPSTRRTLRSSTRARQGSAGHSSNACGTCRQGARTGRFAERPHRRLLLHRPVPACFGQQAPLCVHMPLFACPSGGAAAECVAIILLCKGLPSSIRWWLARLNSRTTLETIMALAAAARICRRVAARHSPSRLLAAAPLRLMASASGPGTQGEREHSRAQGVGVLAFRTGRRGDWGSGKPS